MRVITESDNVHEEFYKEATSKEMSLEKLPAFLKKLTKEYRHDYGTICHALTAGAIATMWAMNRTPQGGITGFQASCIMWEFIKQWMGYKTPMRLIKYEEMLYPQYAHKFNNTISTETWKFLQDEANKKLAEKGAVETVRIHWQSIADGIVPFGYIVKEES